MIVTDSVAGRPAERDVSDCYIFPASSGQRRLWFLAQLEPESHAAYHVRSVIEIDGPLDLLAFQQAFNDVIACHESLRTGIALVDAEPSQVIVPEIAVAVPVIDCAGMPGPRQEEELESVIRHEAVRRFELDAPPLVRLTLLRRSAVHHLLVVVMHHIICDGWSMAIFMSELATAYRNARAGRSPLPEPGIQYADYTVWQAERLTEDRDRTLAEHWRAKLADLPATDLPADFPRLPVRSGRGAARQVRLPGDLLRDLDAVGERCGATRFMTLLAVFKLLLMRYTGQADAIVGTAVANRPMPELERLIGLFANTLVLRTDLSGDPTFTALLGRVRQTCLEAFEHQELPFEKVVEELHPTRDLSRTPLFQVMFLMQNTPGASVGDGELTFTPRPEGARTAKYDLCLVAEPDRDGMQLSLEYSTDLFTAATAELMLRHLVTILRAALDQPGVPVSRYDLTDAADRELISRRTRGPVRPRPDARVHELVAAAAQRTPDAVAIESASEQLSYGVLAGRVAALAAVLAAHGAGPGQLVGVCLTRSCSTVVAQLAVLTTGAACVPLDPHSPPDHLRQLLTGSGVGFVLATTGTTGLVPAGRWRVLDPDQNPPAAPATCPRAVFPAGAPAWIGYAPGRTGPAAGVQVTHGSLVNHLLAVTEAVGIGPGDVVAPLTGAGASLAGTELLLPLVTGGRVVVGPDEARAGAALAALPGAHGTTVLLAAPATWRLLLGAGWRPQPGLRMLCDGPGLDGDLAEQLTAGGSELWNLYGPAEAGIWVSAARVGDPRTLRLGDPLANTTRYVVDQHSRRAAPGVAGELCLGGASVPDGYPGASAATAGRFVPDPFADRAGARMYRTGEVARLHADGGLELLSRLDRQPAADRTAPHRGDPAPDDRTPPRTPAERQVAEIFAEILGVEEIWRSSDFFDLGGHSLLAARFVACLEDRSGVRLRLRDLFKQSTVAAVAEVVAERRGARAEKDDEAVRAIVRALPDTELDSLLNRLTAGRPAKAGTNHEETIEGCDREHR
jgi:non-ribosomal peptide synthetase component F/acyl carrier protein